MKMKKDSKLILGMCLAIGLAIAFSGCGSSATTRSEQPLDDRLIGTWVCAWEPVVNIMVFQPDGAGIMTTSLGAGTAELPLLFQASDGGKTLVLKSGKKLSVNLEGDRYILTGFVNEPLVFHKTQGPVAVAGTSWNFEHPNVSFGYTFVDDGAYQITASGVAEQVLGMLAERTGNELAATVLTGTYSTNGYRVILSPTNGFYLQFDGVNGDISVQEADTYEAIVINDTLFLHNIEYTRK
jgi:hypothetical protein